MTMEEIVDQVSFMLGIPANSNVEEIDLKKAALIAFREIKRYCNTPVEKTVGYQQRIDLPRVGIETKRVLGVQAAKPRLGLTMSSIDSGNVFQIAAAVNAYSSVGQTASLNIDPIMTEMAMAQVRNVLSTDLQWRHDPLNNCLYITHRDPTPSQVTIRYVPDFKDVSELVDPVYEDYLVRMTTANAKIALGRSRSKYTISSSNVSLDGDKLLEEGNSELEAIRAELEEKRRKFIIVN